MRCCLDMQVAELADERDQLEGDKLQLAGENEQLRHDIAGGWQLRVAVPSPSAPGFDLHRMCLLITSSFHALWKRILHLLFRVR